MDLLSVPVTILQVVVSKQAMLLKADKGDER